ATLITDDLQWADSTTLLLLHFLARDLTRLPVLLVGAYRPEVPIAANGTRDSLARLSMVPEGQRLTLRPLSEDETLALVASNDGAALSTAAVRWIVTNSEGNPWLAHLLAQDLTETSSYA